MSEKKEKKKKKVINNVVVHLTCSCAKTVPFADVKATERLKELVVFNQYSTRYLEPDNIFCTPQSTN